MVEWKRSLSAQYAKVRQQLDLTEKLFSGFSGPKNTGGADLMRPRVAQSPGRAYLGVLREPGSLSSCMGHTVEPVQDWPVSGWGAWPLAKGNDSTVESSVFSPWALIPFLLGKSLLSSECSPTKTTSWSKVATSLSCAFWIGLAHHWSWVLRSESL